MFVECQNCAQVLRMKRIDLSFLSFNLLTLTHRQAGQSAIQTSAIRTVCLHSFQIVSFRLFISLNSEEQTTTAPQDPPVYTDGSYYSLTLIFAFVLFTNYLV